MKRLFVILFFITSAMAQQPTKPCPADIDFGFAIAEIQTFRAGHSYTVGPPTIHLQWKNTTSKTMKGIRFSVQFISNLGESTPGLFHYDYGDKDIKPGKKKDAKWELIEYRSATEKGFYVWPIKILYDDDTIWEGICEPFKGKISK